jgi:hypothetical protein
MQKSENNLTLTKLNLTSNVENLSPHHHSSSPSKNKITFESLIRDYRVTSLSSFANYLASIWKELARRSNDKKRYK